MYAYLDRPGIAKDHVIRAFWAASAGKTNEAAAHLAQALWPPKSPSIFETWQLSSDMKKAAQEAYADLISRRSRQAIEALGRAIYPHGIPPHELVMRGRK